MKKFMIALMAALTLASCAFARPKTRFILNVRPELAADRKSCARSLWNACRDVAALQGYRAKAELDDEDATIEHRNDGTPDVIVYEIELGEVKVPHDDIEPELIVRAWAFDKKLISAELSWKNEKDGTTGDKHVAFYRALARRTDLFMPARDAQ